MRQQIENIHFAELESAQIKEHIAELQKALSDSHLSIYDEKQNYLQLHRHYELILQQQRNDKKKLEELHALKAEVEKQKKEAENQNFKNFKDVRPQALAEAALKNKTKVPLNPGPSTQAVLTNQLIAQKIKESETNTNKSEPVKAKGPSSSKSGHSNATTSGIVKTVILPHEDINRMNVQSQQLYAVLQQQEALFRDTVAGYQKDRSVRQQEFDLKEKDYKEQVALLEQRLQSRKDLNYRLTTDYFAYKHKATEDKKRL